MTLVGIGYIVTIIFAGKQGVAAGMDFWHLAFRFLDKEKDGENS